MTIAISPHLSLECQSHSHHSTAVIIEIGFFRKQSGPRRSGDPDGSRRGVFTKTRDVLSGDVGKGFGKRGKAFQRDRHGTLTGKVNMQ